MSEDSTQDGYTSDDVRTDQELIWSEYRALIYREQLVLELHVRSRLPLARAACRECNHPWPCKTYALLTKTGYVVPGEPDET